jgi:hypothetical protein
VKYATTGKPYAEWIKRTILDQTKPRDRVLAVVHKRLIDNGWLSHADVWEGRTVSLTHWGYGIGSNAWKDCNVVLLFGEFHRPRYATIAETLGFKDAKPVSQRIFEGAAGSRMTGDYLTVEEGHLLRWTKQLAARGTVRNIDADGICGPMKLVTTMEFRRLSDKHDALFPGAKVTYLRPEKDRRVSSNGRDRSKGKIGLINVLRFAEPTVTEITSIEVRDRTGIEWSKKGGSYLAHADVQSAMKAHGWRYVQGISRVNPSKFVRTAAVA